MLFKVRKNEHGYFIGSDNKGANRITYYMESEPKIGTVIPILIPLPHEDIMYAMVEDDFLDWIKSNRIEDNISLYGSHYCYLMQLNDEQFFYHPNQSQSGENSNV